MLANIPRLIQLGWNPFYDSQLLPDEMARLMPVRVMAVHRGWVTVAGVDLDCMIPSLVRLAATEEDHATVGDWLLIDRETQQISRILTRASLFKRHAPGHGRRLQLIAANVDNLFIVASCNEDFNIARIERYLVLAHEAGVTPVVVLTKADLTDTPETFAAAVRDWQPQLVVETVNARDPLSVARLAAWCGEGCTVALLGSSGVGKSTIINTLRGSSSIRTQAVREADGKGRHTTTGREMHRLDQGGWLIDTPGMREFHLTDAKQGLAEVFDDIIMVAQACRFSNCAHAAEPGCAVQAGLADGTLDPVRLERWRKLTAQDASQTEIATQSRWRTPPSAGRNSRTR